LDLSELILLEDRRCFAGARLSLEQATAVGLEESGSLHVAEALRGTVIGRVMQHVLVVGLAAMWAVDVKHSLSPF
jgi:hypothetical protein